MPSTRENPYAAVWDDPEMHQPAQDTGPKVKLPGVMRDWCYAGGGKAQFRLVADKVYSNYLGYEVTEVKDCSSMAGKALREAYGEDNAIVAYDTCKTLASSHSADENHSPYHLLQDYVSIAVALGVDNPGLRDGARGKVHNQVRNAIIEAQRAPESTELNPHVDKGNGWERGLKLSLSNPIADPGSRESALEHQQIAEFSSGHTSGAGSNDSVPFESGKHHVTGAEWGDPYEQLVAAGDQVVADAALGYLEWEAQQQFKKIADEDSDEWWSFHLVAEYGKSWREAADMLGISHMTVKRRVKRVQARIRSEVPKVKQWRFDNPIYHDSGSAGYGWCHAWHDDTETRRIVGGRTLRAGETVSRHMCPESGPCKHPEKHAPVACTWEVPGGVDRGRKSPDKIISQLSKWRSLPPSVPASKLPRADEKFRKGEIVWWRGVQVEVGLVMANRRTVVISAEGLRVLETHELHHVKRLAA